MSGNREKPMYFPYCVHCGERPEYFTLGRGQGNDPFAWMYQDYVEWIEEDMWPYIDGSKIDADEEVTYVFCDCCGEIIMREHAPIFVGSVIFYLNILKTRM